MDFAYKHKRLSRRKASGTATTEFLVSLAFFVPLFVTVPVIGKYISFKQKNIESNRYAVWERTVWADEQGRWNDNENTKSDDGIAREVDRRLYGSQIQGLSSSSITDNNMWSDRNSERMLALATKGKHRITVSLNADVSPVKDHFTDNLAYKGIPYIGDGMSKITEVVNSTLGNFVSDCKDIPGVDLKKGMNLGSKTYASITVSANAKNILPSVNNGDSQIILIENEKEPKTTIEDKKHFTFSSSGSILSNAWTAPTEAIFNERVGKLVVDESVRCISSPARLLSLFPIYKEGNDAKNVVSAEKSTILLETYKK